MVQLNKPRGSKSSLPSSRQELRRPRAGNQPSLSSPWHPLLLGVVMGLMLAFLLFRRPDESPFAFFGSQKAETTVIDLLDLYSVPPKDTDYEYDLQPDITIKASKKLFSTLPAENVRTFFADTIKTSQPLIRTLRHLDWIKVDEIQDACLIYTNERDIELFHELEPWQRYNHIPRTSQWADRVRFAKGFRDYAETANRPQFFLPETYDLHVDSQRKQFEKQRGNNKRWVVKSSSGHIRTIEPEQKIVDTEPGEVVQEFICNEMQWDHEGETGGKRPFELRVYWFVASLDPLIVFYMDGFVRIASVNATNGGDSTTFTEEAPWSKFEDFLSAHVRRLGNPNIIVDPATHVRSQLKESLSQLVDAFKEKTFATGGILSAEDSFELYTADYMLDTGLDIWLMKARADNCTGTNESSFFEDYYFKLDMHHQMFYGMAMILDEIWEKQAKGRSLLPLHYTGKWEVIYAGSWRFEYDGYERTKKACP